MQIGFFDSGLGGLAVLLATVRHLPQYDYCFFGDTEHLPLGDKSEEEIFEYTRAGVRYLFEQGAALVIVACNTASAETVRKLQDEYLVGAFPDRKLLGVIIPTVEEILAESGKRVLLIGTTRTVASGKYEHELSLRGGGVDFSTLATPELVPLIEAGDVAGAVQSAIASIESHLKGSAVDVIVLGCTHYSLIAEGLRDYFGEGVHILAQTDFIPQKIAHYLALHPEIAKRLTERGVRRVHLTKHTEAYDRLIAQFLGGAFIADD